MVSLFAKIWCRSPYPNFHANTEENFTKNSRKNESGNGIRLTQKFLKPLKVYIREPKKKFIFKIVPKKKIYQATHFV